MDTPGRRCVQDQSVLAEDDAVFVGFFNDGKRVVVDAHVSQPVAAALESLVRHCPEASTMFDVGQWHTPTPC